MQNCKKIIYLSKCVCKSLSCLRLLTVNNSARNGDMGCVKRRTQGEIRYSGVFWPTNIDRIPVFSPKIIPK